MARGFNQWAKLKPKCVGCIYMGYDVPCEYAFIKGITPLALGVKLDPEGKGGCALKEVGKREWRKVPLSQLEQHSTWKSKIDHDKAMELYEQGKIDKEIAKVFGVGVTAVYAWRTKNGLSPNGSKGFHKIDREKAMRMYETGASDGQIAKEIGVSVGSVRAWRVKNNLPAVNPQGSKQEIDEKTAYKLYKAGLQRMRATGNNRHRQWRKKGLFMDFFFMILSAALTLGFCWLVNRENFAYHIAAVFLLETCVAFWIVLPK